MSYRVGLILGFVAFLVALESKSLAPAIRSIQVALTTGDGDQTKSIHRNNNNSMDNEPSFPAAVLVIAVFPRDPDRIAALWSQLECFAAGVDTIVVSSPSWSREIVDPVLDLATRTIPHLAAANSTTTVEARYYTNDRYDVGLWCDALHDHHQTGRPLLGDDRYDSFLLINDSVWAVEHSSQVLDALRAQNMTLVSMGYSLLSKFWVESIYRGFSASGIQRFLNHSCVPKTHPFFCTHLRAKARRKRCIVENFEINVVDLYPREQVLGLYHIDVPPEMIANRHLQRGKTWVGHWEFWNRLRTEQHFPLAKISWDVMLDMTRKRRMSDLSTCTQYWNYNISNFVRQLNYSVSFSTL